MIGESIGNYRIVARLGEGGMGAVYLGEHRRITRQVAIKVLLPELSNNHRMVSRFFNEARATSLIRHPGIVEITDCDVLRDGRAYLVMELLRGESLGSRLRRGDRVPPARAVSIAGHIADALAAAHEKEIVHRDLKPDNVFLLADVGPGEQPIKILDFGIAKLMRPDSHGQKTRTGSLVGTPEYMSPEQCRGVGAVDHRTDIYSLGCILFEMLSGRRPFVSLGFGELIQSHLSEAAPALASFDSTIPPAIGALVARMLAKAPDDRPQTMRALGAELDAIQASLAPSPPETGEARQAADGPTRTPAARTSASSEQLTVDGAFDRRAARHRRRSRLIKTAALAVALGGTWIWRVTAHHPAGPQPGVASAIAVPAPLPVSTAASPSPPPPAAEPSSPPAPEKVNVVVVSEPPAADVCLAKDRILIGRTKLEWTPEKSSRRAKLLVRKRGYRGRDITVGLDRDVTKHVTLNKLGPDELDNVDNCVGARVALDPRSPTRAPP
jgi:serine/threonine-protein kinase